MRPALAPEVISPRIRTTVLGCGTSGGIPLPNGTWGDCDPKNPKNLRTRTSLAVHIGDKNWLIDLSPDLRAQCLRENLTRIDGALITHAHADHVSGLDDLRSFFYSQSKKPIPLYMDAETFSILEQRFPYIFHHQGSPLYQPYVAVHIIEPYKPFCISDVPVTAFPQDHGHGQRSLGFRFPSFAYSTDVVHFENDAHPYLKGVPLWFVDCAGLKTKGTHAGLDTVLNWVQEFTPGEAILIHMGREIDYNQVQNLTPANIHPAFDGLTR